MSASVTIIVRAPPCELSNDDTPQLMRCRGWMMIASHLDKIHELTCAGADKLDIAPSGLRQTAAFARHYADGSGNQERERCLVAASGRSAASP